MSAGEADFGLEISKGFLAKVTMAALGFAGSVVFARVLGPTDYGAFYVILALVHVLDNPVTGWGVACKKRITEIDFPEPEALGSGLIGALALPVVIVPAVYVGNRLTGLFDLEGLFVPFTLLFVVICAFAVTNRILSARSNFSSAEWSDTLRSLFTTPAQLALVLLRFGTAGMVYGLALATALTIPYVIYRIGVRPALPSRDSIASIASYAKYSIPNGFIGTAQSRMDILLLGAVLSSAAAGKYKVALQLTMVGTFVGGVMSKGLMARVSEFWSRDDREAAVEDVSNALGFASVLSIPIFFGAAAMPEDLLVTVFGPQYSGVGTVLVGLALFRALNMQSQQLGSTIAGLDRPDINTRIGLAVLVTNLALGIAFVVEFGVIGVVAATVISEVFRYGLLAAIVKRTVPDINLLARPLATQLVAGAAMFLVVDRLHALVGVSWVGDLVALVGVGAVVYLGILTAISDTFRRAIRGVVGDAVSEIAPS